MAQVLLCGALILTLSMGIRHGFGLWLQPVTMERGWSREAFALAIAIQNLGWGVAAPLAGVFADRFGAFRVLLVGSVLYAAGLAGMATATSSLGFALSAGVMIGVAQAGTYKTAIPAYTLTADYHVLGFTVVPAGTQVHDVHRMVVLGFQPPLVSLLYIVAVGLLSLHLLHGMESLFRTLGWRNASWSRALRAGVTLLCLAYFAGNLAIPGAVLTGALKAAPVTKTAAAK